MHRPWCMPYGTCEEDHFALGDSGWKRRLSAGRLTSEAPACAALSTVHRRKLSNLFASLTAGATGAVTSRVLTEQAAVDALAAAHLAAAGVAFGPGHTLVAAAKCFYAGVQEATVTSTGTKEGITYHEYLAALCAVLSREEAAPDWLLAVFHAQFALAASDEQGMSKAEFLAWRTATQRCTPAQLAQATCTDGWGGHAPTPEELYFAADGGRKGRVTAEDWARLVKRFWTSSEHWDELNAYSL